MLIGFSSPLKNETVIVKLVIKIIRPAEYFRQAPDIKKIVSPIAEAKQRVQKIIRQTDCYFTNLLAVMKLAIVVFRIHSLVFFQDLI
jgi:hypothetical protein